MSEFVFRGSGKKDVEKLMSMVSEPCTVECVYNNIVQAECIATDV